MSQIIINEKNFERFSARLSQIIQKHTNGKVSLGKLQSQELFSQILGTENVHELRINLKKEKISKDYTFKLHYNEVERFFNHELTSEEESLFIDKLALRMGYVVFRIMDICGYECTEWNYPLKKPVDSPSILNCIVYSYFPNQDVFKKDMKEMMQFGFEYINKKIITFDKYISAFPTKWLYEDFENKLIEEAKQHNVQELQKEENFGILRVKSK